MSPNVAGLQNLERLRRRIEQIATAGGREEILSALAVEAHQQTLDCFIEQRDPYGRAWAPRKKPPAWAIRAFGLMNENHKLLDRTGKGIESITSKATSTGIKIRVGKDYMGYHLTGTSKMVARKYLPIDGLGPIWERAFQRVADRTLRKMLAL